jgi:hypothetical protein
VPERGFAIRRVRRRAALLIEIHLDGTDQILQALNQVSTDGLEPLGMAGDVTLQQGKKRSESRILLDSDPS